MMQGGDCDRDPVALLPQAGAAQGPDTGSLTSHAFHDEGGGAKTSFVQLRKSRIFRSSRFGSLSVFDMMIAPSTTHEIISARSSRSIDSRGV